MHNIVVVKRSRDWKAHIKDHPEYWDCGTTPDEAIGALIRTHGARLNITVD